MVYRLSTDNHIRSSPDDFNSGGFRVDPAEGQFFEGDIAGVQLKAVDVKSDFDGQLTFGKVSARPILLTLYLTMTLIH